MAEQSRRCDAVACAMRWRACAERQRSLRAKRSNPESCARSWIASEPKPLAMTSFPFPIQIFQTAEKTQAGIPAALRARVGPRVQHLQTDRDESTPTGAR